MHFPSYIAIAADQSVCGVKGDRQGPETAQVEVPAAHGRSIPVQPQRLANKVYDRHLRLESSKQCRFHPGLGKIP